MLNYINSINLQAMRGLKIIVVLISLILPVQSFSQAVYAQVSSKQVQIGEMIEYSVIANVSINQITPPSFEGFQVMGQPSQGTSIQMVNGQSTMQLSVTWQLLAQREGKFTFGKALVLAGGQHYETRPIVVEVFKGNSHQVKSANEAFIRTTVNKSKCFLGEEVVIIQKIYSQQQIVGFQEFEQPAYEGFYSVPQETKDKTLAVENIDGVNYYTYELFRTVGIANKSGKALANPIKGVVVLRKPAANKARNIFEQFFGAPAYEDVPVEVRSKLVTVEVSELPEAGKPEGFYGAVGDYAYRVACSRSEVKAHDAINLRLTITGTGNLKLLEAPKLKLPQDFEVYDPKVTETDNSKTFDYLIIPRTEGTYNLGPFDFSYFSTVTKKYINLPSGEVPLKVLPGDPGAAKVYQPRNDVRQTENDIRYIKKGEFALTKNDDEFFNSYIHLSLLSLSLLGFGAGMWLRRRHQILNSDLVAVRNRKASRMASKHLVEANKLMIQGSKEAFYTSVLTALYNYLSYKLNIAIADINRENIQAQLMQRNLSEVLREDLMKTLDTCEFAKYAPGAVAGELKVVYEETARIITAMEEALNKK